MSKTSITTKKKLTPIHPGEILLEDLQDCGISINGLARAVGVPPNRISQIVNGKRDVTADTAVRLARYFGGTAQFWLNLQSIYDLRTAERSAETKRALRQIEPLEHSAAA